MPPEPDSSSGPKSPRGSFARWIPAGILVLALLARLGFLLTVAHPELRSGQFFFPDGSDEADYHQLAVQLVERGVYALSADGPATAKRTPGLPLAMAGLYVLGGPDPRLAVLWVLLGSLGVVAMAGLLTRQLGAGPRAGALAMLGAALLPTLVFTSAGIWSEPPALFLALLGLYFYQEAFLRDVERSEAPLALAGLALAASYLHRASIGPVIVLLGLHASSLAWRRRQVRPLAVFVLLTALPILAWGARNQTVFGHWMLGNTESSAALWGANNPVTAGLEAPVPGPDGTYDRSREAAAGAYRGSWIPLSYLPVQAPPGISEIERQRWFSEQVRGFVREHPGAFLGLLVGKALRVLTAEPLAPSILGESPSRRRLKWAVAFVERWFLLLFGGWGLLSLARQKHPLLPTYGSFLLGSLAVVGIAYVNARIFLPVSILLLLPAALACDRLGARLEARSIA